jgi:hypothetical protein
MIFPLLARTADIPQRFFLMGLRSEVTACDFFLTESLIVIFIIEKARLVGELAINVTSRCLCLHKTPHEDS